VIAPARPGYPGTPLDPDPPDWRSLLDELGVQRVWSYGISGGGPSAIAYAASDPDRCIGVILIAAVLSAKQSWLARAQSHWMRSLGWIPGYGRGIVRDETHFLTLPDPPLLRQPVLLIHGKQDPIAPYEEAVEYAQRLPRGTLRTLPGGHLAFLWRRGQVRAEIAGWMRGCGRT
jgi:pimeloyl-ACP methyl ester carboxylesterase